VRLTGEILGTHCGVLLAAEAGSFGTGATTWVWAGVGK
jgi:hypothetical protein